MKNSVRNRLIADIVEGLVVALIFTVAIPWGAVAQEGLSQAVGNAGGNIVAPFLKIISYVSYGMGAVMTISGIAGAKKHADNPTQNPLGPVLGRLGAGAAFLAAPSVVGMLQGTGAAVTGGSTSTVKTIGF